MNYLGQILSGAVVGLGIILMIWSKLRQAEVQRARADTLQSWAGGKLEAQVAESAATKAADAAKLAAGSNPLDW